MSFVRNAWSGQKSMFQVIFHVLLYKFLNKFCLLTLWSDTCLQILFLAHMLSFCFLEADFWFEAVPPVYSCLCRLDLQLESKLPSPSPRHVLPLSSSATWMDVDSTFESPTHLELTFVCGVKWGINGIFCVWVSHVPNITKRLPFPALCPCLLFCDKHQEQKKLGEERGFVFSYRLLLIMEGSPRRN